MLDFDDCASHWYVADIVYALREVGEFNIESPIIKKFIEGYRSETNLDLNILEKAWGFERLHKLVSFAILIRSVDIEESTEYPDWLIDLRIKLCGIIDGYRFSFEMVDK